MQISPVSCLVLLAIGAFCHAQDDSSSISAVFPARHESHEKRKTTTENPAPVNPLNSLQRTIHVMKVRLAAALEKTSDEITLSGEKHHKPNSLGDDHAGDDVLEKVQGLQDSARLLSAAIEETLREGREVQVLPSGKKVQADDFEIAPVKHDDEPNVLVEPFAAQEPVANSEEECSQSEVEEKLKIRVKSVRGAGTKVKPGQIAANSEEECSQSEVEEKLKIRVKPVRGAGTKVKPGQIAANSEEECSQSEVEDKIEIQVEPEVVSTNVEPETAGSINVEPEPIAAQEQVVESKDESSKTEVEGKLEIQVEPEHIVGANVEPDLLSNSDDIKRQTEDIIDKLEQMKAKLAPYVGAALPSSDKPSSNADPIEVKISRLRQLLISALE